MKPFSPLAASRSSADRRKLARARARALAPLLETLEGRMLLHAGHLHVNVNFQPASSPVPSGYLVDSGQAFGNRGNGYNYGFDAAITTGTRDRGKTTDQRYDTLNHTQAYGVRSWEIDVPNGQYTVRVVAGDPGYYDSVYKFNVENVLTVNGTPTSGSRFVEGTQTVTVGDGRLTISNASGSVNNKLAFVEIQSAEPAQAQVSVSAHDASAAEDGDTGSFLFTRTGDLAQPLVVTYGIAGTAINGSDYQQLLGSVTIPSGSATQLVTINPIDDAAVEPSETVVLSILPGDGYDPVAGSATVTITDNDAATGFSTKINFQPGSAATPSGYLVDGGDSFAARNGLSYGWSSDNRSWARDRNKTADQRYDTLNHFAGKHWELAVPNGTYAVRVIAGDPQYYDSIYRIDAEGVRIIDATPSSGTRFFEGAAVVTVTDGRLTLTNASGSSNNKINFIEVTQQSDGQEKPTITVSAPTTNASENGPTSRAFTLSRSGGSTAEDLTVYFTIGGTATNGVDYQVINSPVTIPAGSTSINVTVNPFDDVHVETTETVTLTLVSQTGYTIGAASNATIRINDNDSLVGNTITWTTRASNPLGRAEALRAVVDGKLYVFGGFASTGPVNRHDVYDPATNTWTPRAAMPTRLTHAGVAVDGRDIYVAGGYIGTSSTGTGWAQKFGVTDVWKYNVDSNEWTAFTPLPKEVAGGGLALLGRQLHWVSGNNNQRQDIGDHFVLDLDNAAAGWKAAAPLPFGRSHLGVLTLNGKIYAVGGQFGNDDGLTTQKYVHVWDPANPNTWSRLADLPTAISHIASATFVLGDRIVVAGGETAHTRPTDLVYAYDPATNEWAAMTKLPAPRFSGVAAEIGGDIFFTTGSTQTTTWKGVVS